MAKQIKNENAEAVVEAVSKTEQFFNENGKLISIICTSVIVLAAALFCWNKFIYIPAADEAKGQMAFAEEYFRAGDYEVALNGDGNVQGFAQIIDEYGAKAGASANLYAGVCELHLGNWEMAISYLENYKGKDAILKARASRTALPATRNWLPTPAPGPMSTSPCTPTASTSPRPSP